MLVLDHQQLGPHAPQLDQDTLAMLQDRHNAQFEKLKRRLLYAVKAFCPSDEQVFLLRIVSTQSLNP